MQLNSKQQTQNANSLAKKQGQNNIGSKLPREQLTLIKTTRSLQNAKKRSTENESSGV